MTLNYATQRKGICTLFVTLEMSEWASGNSVLGRHACPLGTSAC